MLLKRHTNEDRCEEPSDMIKVSSTWFQDDLCTFKLDFTDTSHPNSSGGLYLQYQHFLEIAVKLQFVTLSQDAKYVPEPYRSLELRKLCRLDCSTMAVLEVRLDRRRCGALVPRLAPLPPPRQLWLTDGSHGWDLWTLMPESLKGGGHSSL